MFTGGSLLLGGAGRTDLMGRDRAEALARAQYRSIRRLGACLPADTAVCPTHGFGSYCSAGMPTGGGATIGDQRRTNPAFQLDEERFVDRLLSGLRPYPRYFAAMAPRNAWFPTAANLAPLPEVPLDEVIALAMTDGTGAGATVILDVRPRAAYAAAHVAGSLHIDGRGSLGDVVRLAGADRAPRSSSSRPAPRRHRRPSASCGGSASTRSSAPASRRTSPRSPPLRGCRRSRSSAARRFVTSRRSSDWAKTS